MSANHHATLVVLRDRGILIRGEAGSGKTGLGLALMAQAHARGWFARLVADDQVWLAGLGTALVGTVPSTIAGLAEIRPLGPRPTAFEPRARVDLIVDLVPAECVARMEEARCLFLEGVAVATLTLPQREREACIPAVLNFVFPVECA